METKRELQIRAKELIDTDPKETISICKRLWNEFEGDNIFNLYDALLVVKAAKNNIEIDFDFVHQVAKKYADKEEVINNFKWFVFRKYLKGKKGIELLPNEVNINRMLSLTSQSNLREDNAFPCPYTIAVIELSKGHSKNLFNARRIYDYLKKLNSSFLSKKNKDYIKDGEQIKVASDLESYYALNSKSLLKLEMYEECKLLCEIALNDLDEFHYNNDLWFKMRIASCYEKLGEFEKSEELFKELVSTKAGNDKWFLYYAISDLYYQQNNLEKALKYSINATFYCTDLDKMNGLLLLQTRILVKSKRIEEAKTIAELVAAILNKYELNHKQDYQNLFAYFNIDVQNCKELNSIYKSAQSIWIQERYSGLYEINGKIIFIHQSGKMGKIKTLDNRVFDFHKRDFNKKQRSIIELKDSKVSFIEMKSYNGKYTAENIKILEKVDVVKKTLLVGSVHKGRIKNIVNYGIFVKLIDGTVGLVHTSRMPSQIIDTFNTLYSIGEVLNVRVEKVLNNKIDLKILNE
ncbi:tetratricopeptide (TPR) repeat protein [Flavobacterium sp. PL11]|uniref:S1 RNA-binding domain-containing protein n=1 Tax=Flavobacterium sp. PL11 TaxID=3071717 RepID=UPI002E0467FD|nr:tetratricopeptide (TPR) repeat protein [Flavobacterium sp. PL11]